MKPEALFLGAVAGGFFFFGHLVVPDIVAQAQLAWHGFGFANADCSTLVQKFLNKSVIGGFFWNMFHAVISFLYPI